MPLFCGHSDVGLLGIDVNLSLDFDRALTPLLVQELPKLFFLARAEGFQRLLYAKLFL